MSRQILPLLLACLLVSTQWRTVQGQDSDKARRIAEASIDAMGGMDDWKDHRYLVWDIFGEKHYWDKWSGDFRWQSDSLLVLMNIRTHKGRAWIEGKEVQDPDKRKELLDRAYARWVNNSYWLLLPYKLLDPGVHLRYVGVDTSQAGEVSDVLELTFDNVGLTPNNRYRVFISKKTGMICQWAYYENREDQQPGFVRPMDHWEEYNGMWLSTGRGDKAHNITNLALPDELPRKVFTDPAPVAWQAKRSSG